MFLKSQPLDPKIYGKVDLDNYNKTEQKIISQRIGKMFDDMLDENKTRKINLGTHLSRIWNAIKSLFYDTKYAIRNHFVWLKTINGLRPWEGFDGMITVMQTHIKDYIETEEKYGHSLEEYKNEKIATAKETLEILERMKDPHEYSSRRRDEVDVKYPKYKYLITKYEESTSYSGNFVAQGNGWVGKESGKDPREGYFEFVDGKFELASSPDQSETDRLLAELTKYHEEVNNAYKQAETDSDEDFEKLGQLFKDNLYSWWD